MNDEHHVIDIASVLKTFFRDLPEPLLPHAYHEIFLRCMLLKERQLDALLLCCLLLPPEHLNTLTYFMQVCALNTLVSVDVLLWLFKFKSWKLLTY